MVQHLLDGLSRFRREAFPRYREQYRRLVEDGQKPSALFIGCSDSRIVPDLLMGSGPGELFIVRNLANVVPPWEPDHGFHGTSAAIEFATLVLGVTDIIVCGHSHCGGVRALYEPPTQHTPHIDRWLELGAGAKLEGPVTEEVLRRTEQRSVVLQLERLMSYPMVAERVEQGTLALHGWHYILEEGQVLILDVEEGAFRPMAE
ncbi:MAG TPA: carbonic anhydrase [Longimicrobiales bacterium]|nr:carbonic anhydrase [Longimicrobiales bacterium]